MEKTLSEAEELYIAYWEKNRLKEKKLLNQLLIGLPLGIIFGAPVLLNLFLGWNKSIQLPGSAKVNPVVLIVAVLLIVVFVAIFSRRHKWEMKEQQYLEFIAKREALQAETQKKAYENPEPPAAKKAD